MRKVAEVRSSKLEKCGGAQISFGNSDQPVPRVKKFSVLERFTADLISVGARLCEGVGAPAAGMSIHPATSSSSGRVFQGSCRSWFRRGDRRPRSEVLLRCAQPAIPGLRLKARVKFPNVRFHLPLRHEVGERAGVRWWSGSGEN